jgi:hypothetical protein
MPARYQARVQNLELQISNLNLAEQSPSMDRATTKQEGEKRKQECRIIINHSYDPRH